MELHSSSKTAILFVYSTNAVVCSCTVGIYRDSATFAYGKATHCIENVIGGCIHLDNDQRNPRTTNHCTSDATALQHRRYIGL